MTDAKPETPEAVEAEDMGERVATHGVRRSSEMFEAAAMLEKLILDDQYEEFLTLPAYRAID